MSLFSQCILSDLPLKVLEIKLNIVSDYARRKEQELNESNGNNENLQAQIDSLKKKIRELEVCFSAHFRRTIHYQESRL